MLDHAAFKASEKGETQHDQARPLGAQARERERERVLLVHMQRERE